MSPLDPDIFEANPFPVEPEIFSETLHRREASARETLRKTSLEELQGLVSDLFPDKEHPWFASFSQFIEEHRSEPAFRGETSDGYAFVYYPQSNHGFWYENEGKAFAVGLLGPTSLKALSEIIAERGYV
jgi:hypothetical protein